MERRWYDTKELKDMNTLFKLQDMYHIQTPSSFQEFIRTHNAGKVTPSPYIWLQSFHRGFLFHRVVDFNQNEDYNTIYAIKNKLDKLSTNNYIPFGLSKDKRDVFVIGDKSIYVCDTRTNESMLVSGNFDIFYNEYLK